MEIIDRIDCFLTWAASVFLAVIVAAVVTLGVQSQRDYDRGRAEACRPGTARFESCMGD